MRRILIVLLCVAIPLGGHLPGELYIKLEDNDCGRCGGGGSDTNTTYPMDLSVRTEEDTETVTVQTDLHNTSISVVDDETTIGTEGDTTKLIPQLTNVTVEQDGIVETAVNTLSPETYTSTGMLVLAENVTYQDVDGDLDPECVGWTKWETLHVDTDAEEVIQDVVRNATAFDSEGDSRRTRNTTFSETANPGVMQSSMTWGYGGWENIVYWEIRFRRYVDGTLEDDTGTFKVSSENVADC